MLSVLEGTLLSQATTYAGHAEFTKSAKRTTIMIYVIACFIPDQVTLQLNKVTANNIPTVKLFY